MKRLSFSIAVATMNGKALKTPHFSDARYMIVDQGTTPMGHGDSKYFYMPTRGLSLSRNVALDECRSDVLLVADDDVCHVDGVEEIVINEFLRTGADIITFQIVTPEGVAFKPYAPSRFCHRVRSIMRVNSIEIAMRVESVRNVGVRFDTAFGLGAKYPTGEEIIFLADALKAGLDVRYAPVPIVVHPAESSGSSLLKNDRLIRAKGAMFRRIFGLGGYVAAMAFAVRHHGKSGYGLFGFLVRIFSGVSGFCRGGS